MLFSLNILALYRRTLCPTYAPTPASIQIKEFTYFPSRLQQQERKEIIEAFRAVDEVILTQHEPNTTDISICKELEHIRPDVFANGGDRKDDNIPEYALCQRLGIEMVFNVGRGGKVQSSSDLTKAAAKATQNK